MFLRLLCWLGTCFGGCRFAIYSNIHFKYNYQPNSQIDICFLIATCFTININQSVSIPSLLLAGRHYAVVAVLACGPAQSALVVCIEEFLHLLHETFALVFLAKDLFFKTLILYCDVGNVLDGVLLPFFW